MNLRKRVYEIVEVALADDRTSRVFDATILTLIALNVLTVALETVDAIGSRAGKLFDAFEVLSVTIFSIEYALRLWSCTSDPRFARPVVGRLRFALRPLVLIDLVAILPFYLAFLSVDLRFIRALRLMRVFRVAKLGRYSAALHLLGRVLRSSKNELLVTFSAMAIVLVIASCLIYYAEHDAQPDVFTSIPASVWWGVTTLTTVGYGDTYPVTGTGKVIASVISIFGVGLFALPAGILGGAFVKESRKDNEAPDSCPHCGGRLSQ